MIVSKRTPKAVANKNDLYERAIGYILIAPATILLLVFTIYPVFYLLYRSLFSGNLISSKMNFVGFDNYTRLMTSSEFHQVLRNTMFYTFIVVVLTMMFAVLIAVWLNEKKMRRLNDIVSSFIFTPHVVSIVSVSTLFLWLMDSNAGLLNLVITSLGFQPYTFLASPKTALFSLSLVMVWKSIGYYSLLIMAALQNIPSNIYEAAVLDDAPKIKTFFKITLPMISPTILFVSVVATIQSFRVFDTVSVMTQGGPVNSTNTLVYYIYQYAFRYGKPGYACAAGVVLLIFVCIVTYIQFGVGSKRVHYQ
jgi:sn-glycerol 3-phosphate transport system permease protein